MSSKNKNQVSEKSQQQQQQQQKKVVTTERRVPQVWTLLKYIFISLCLIAAVEYFKFGTRINYEWFHCTPIKEQVGGPSSSVIKMWAVGGPSCDKRGEFKTLFKRISRDYDPNDEPVAYCFVENKNIPSVHYPIENGNKGEPGYVAYVGYMSDYDLIEAECGENQIFHV
ncbi:hypothetical protein Kpol_1028p71 [Vanderwaltozyma polyspora DSM 70294]|uniref:Ceramide synthase subunit LIP1 n=1 Tax=Vanderwaltozyma polyspora (strain ATCC 22028 / DSM 70294 / BCRC 21397 / CBS 2163 / NBRC 10782 / NRRL Y-8283 / UCD 57-17) TaxID=436907 RepID=A7TG39_VANPO|nr:uncharacterized protein Kpol_1028p71 [Vanderwaltozyma polyspora DSM 70294]EDO18796.1 hypothetical protein Kpol_1028p71 [Vanderwaltozyma polyspora DSM 70294]